MPKPPAPATREERVIFAFTPSDIAPENIPVLAFIMPEASWTYMQSGLGHEFDLTALGIPLRVVIGRTATHATGMEELRRAHGETAERYKDLRDADVRFGRKADQ